MSLIVSSTTDSQADVERAAEMVEGDELVSGEAESSSKPADGEGFATPIISEGGVASTTDDQTSVHQAAEELREAQQEKRDAYLGKTRRKLLNRLSRMHGEVEELRGRLAQYEGQPSEQQQNGEQPEPTRQAQQQQQSPPPSQDDLRWEAARIEAEIAYPHKLEAAKLRYPDFEASLKAVDGHQVPVWCLEAMKMQSHGADVVYLLS